MAAPVVLPEIVTPKAEAVTDTYTPAQASSWTVPANVTSINVTLKGGSGGIGGIDCGADCTSEPGGPRGVITYTFNVSPGDLIGIFPGNKGVAGTSTRLGGADTTLLGTFDGGDGGAIGDYGGSGQGGGGGAASVLTINGTIRAVAAGAGGGGGAANENNSATAGQDYSASRIVNNSYTGGTGTKPVPGNCAGSQVGNGSQRDGGGGGGGGGGWFAGTGGGIYVVSSGAECAGYGGSRGGNYLKDNSNTETIGTAGSSETVADTNGSIDITYTVGGSSGACTPMSTTDVDIFRVLKFTNTSTCTWTVPAGVTTVDFFMVGAGGGGGGGAGSGGAGGGSISRSAYRVTAGGSLNLTVGIGGRGGIPSASKAGAGLSTVIVDGASTFTSFGGGAGAQGPDRVNYPVGGTTSNGTTAIGLQGGAGGLSSDVGGNPTPGQRGSTNYFYGVENQYAGGGSGGSYPGSGGSISAVASFYGGGSSGSAASGTGTNGGDASPNTGAGGGGGTSANSQTSGGRGADGIILIRYAINSADAFPSSLSSSLTYRFAAGDYQVQPYVGKTWINSAGTSAPVATANITGSPTLVAQDPLDSGNSTGSSKTELAVRFSTTQGANLLDLQSGYTVFHVARYVRGGTTKRIINATGSDWISGFDNGEKIAYHTAYLAYQSQVLSYKWQLSSDQAYAYRANGLDVSKNDESYGTQATSVTGFGINQQSTQRSDAQVSDILVFNRELTNGEIRAMENYLARLHGLTLDSLYFTSETDTAFNTNGLDLFAQKDIRNNLNDTFTAEFWLKPTSHCNTNVCTIMAAENSYRFIIRNGKFEYILKGTDSWAWVPTGVAVVDSEWHHVAISKELSGNRNDSVKVYLDGKLIYTKIGSPYVTSTSAVASPSDSNSIAQISDQRRIIGSIFNGTERFYGQIDEVKVWKGFRSATQIAEDMYSNDGSNPQMQFYYDFNAVAGTRINDFKIPNLAYGGSPRSDLYATTGISSFTFSDVKTVVTSSDTYTTVSFPRSYITQFGGWKAPSGVTQIQTVVVAGGGGGGGGYEGGGGGAGGFIETVTSVIPGATYQIRVGTGGRGAGYLQVPTNGDSSTAFGITTLGGGYGTYEYHSFQGAASSGGSGGGGGWGNSYVAGTGTPGQGNDGGSSSALNTNPPCPIAVFVGGGGGGAGTQGQAALCTKGGNGGDGKYSVVAGTTLAAGGGGSLRVYGNTANLASSYQGLGGSRTGNVSLGGDSSYYTNVAVGATGGATNGKYGTGSGGGAGHTTDSTVSPNGPGGWGGTGIVALRYITAIKPTYTKPTVAYLNVGMTETFTTNVAVDSATAFFTRTFKWESITPTSGGAYTTLKVGTGAGNASFSWVPSDTSTTGSGFLYRLTVTDSDTAGLFITDSSTAYAVINPALVVTSTAASNSLAKKIDVSRNETFTITLGTPTYRATLSPVIPGISIDTSTAGSVILKIAETATVGTWLETLTVMDSVSASISFPLTITVAAPPTLVNTGEVVTTGQVFAIDAASSASYNRSTGAWSDISGSKRTITVNSSSGTPIFSDDSSGVIKFDKSKYQALYTSGIGKLANWTIDSWIRIDEEPGSQRCAVTSEYVLGVGINYFMCIDTSRTIFTGFYIYNGWTYMRTTQVVPLNTWVHLVGTWNGSKVKLYINGVLAPGTEIYESAGLVAPGTATQNTYISKWWDSGIQSDAAYYSPISTGSVRIYNLALSETQTAQNYSATKERFTQGNLTQLKPTQKYGVLTLDSFTATSGYDTKTVAFALGDRPGIDWDTTTVSNRINLSVQESLTVGTYYDTITVTDSLGQSTYLPITFTVTKADTLTVTMGSPLTTVYNGGVPAAAPRATISGLVGVDTATVLTRYDTATVGTTCAAGGVCKIGDTGPGGGKVFYISETVINAATGVSEGGVYLEVAPLGWHTTQGQEEALAWSSVTTSVPGTLSSIGAGAENSRLVYSQLGASSAGFNVIVNKTIGGKSDWFVPSLGELEKVYENLWATGLDTFTSSRNMLSSTQDPSNTAQAMQLWNAGGITAAVSKTTGYYMRPIRAFGGTTTPTESDSYTAQGYNLTFGVGAASNYYNVVYETSTLKITQANQDKLTINLYGAVAGSPFTLQIAGGSGPGAITETVTAGSTALNCRISNRVLSNDTPATEQKTCNISITKASSRNYKAETLTATVYFMTFVNNQPTGQVGSGSTIALNGVTSFETSTVTPPSITGFSTLTLSLGAGGSFTITGTGFTGTITVKFSRNKVVSATSGDGTTLVIPVSTISSAGATSGRVVVITAAGEAVSDQSLTITP